MINAKRRQRDDFFNYYTLDRGRIPVGVEVVRFLNAIPSVSYNEYDIGKAGDLIENDAIIHHYQRITEEEYQAAYKPATAGEFRTYLSL